MTKKPNRSSGACSCSADSERENTRRVYALAILSAAISPQFHPRDLAAGVKYLECLHLPSNVPTSVLARIASVFAAGRLTGTRTHTWLRTLATLASKPLELS